MLKKPAEIGWKGIPNSFDKSIDPKFGFGFAGNKAIVVWVQGL